MAPVYFSTNFFLKITQSWSKMSSKWITCMQNIVIRSGYKRYETKINIV